MTITFKSHTRGVMADFSGSPNTGDKDTIPITLIPGLLVGTVIVFGKEDVTDVGITTDRGLVPKEDVAKRELSKVFLPVVNGTAEYTVTSIRGVDYVVERGGT